MAYEFNAGENAVIRRTGKRTKLWGIMTLGSGFLGLLAVLAALSTGSFSPVAAGVYVLLALIPIMIGRNFIQAGNSLAAVVTTEGSDIDHLMASMAGLAKAFTILSAATALWAALVLMGIALTVAAPELGG
jgi:beta-lactamase regulating signal transducer with metallopeptidase domain